MAYNYEVDDSKTAKFNAGIAQTLRIHDILKVIDSCRANPKAWFDDYMDYAYNVWIRKVTSLYKEFFTFMDDNERLECISYKKAIEEALKKYPIMELKHTHSPNHSSMVPNGNILDAIIKHIEEYDSLVRDYGAKYKILTTTKMERGMI